MLAPQRRARQFLMPRVACRPISSFRGRALGCIAGGGIGMATTQLDKGNVFRALHQGPAPFVIANAWDAGSARILAGLGFPALATSSGASAGVYGRRDGGITRDQALAHARAIVAATDLPVSADLESGFGEKPEEVAETYRQAAAVGLVGATLEDADRKSTRLNSSHLGISYAV